MIPLYRKQWVPRVPQGIDAVQAEHIAGRMSQELNIHPLAARLLVNRGLVSTDQALPFLKASLAEMPDPFLMTDMDRAVDRIIQAWRTDEKVEFHTDYDCDGVVSAAILSQFAHALGVRTNYFIPSRHVDGYGLSGAAIEAAARRGVKVIVSADTGISAHQEAALCKRLKIDLIVTDHHTVGDVLPDAFAVVNPHRPGCPYPDKNLSGSGVAFMLVVALRKRLRDMGSFKSMDEPDVGELLDMVALATVSDLVPISSGVNRAMVRSGLHQIAAGRRPGLKALVDVAGLKKISAGAISFALGPRLNSAGRLGDASIGVQLLLDQDPLYAEDLAKKLDQFNRDRQKLEAEVLALAIQRVDQGEAGRSSIVLADERFSGGVVGIVCSRLVERYHRPALLISLANDQGKGSGRSIPGLHLFEALKACDHHLANFGGHEMAAGFSLAASEVPAFAAAFDDFASQALSEDDLVPRLKYDADVSLNVLGLDLLEQLDFLAPFGMGNPNPVFVARSVWPERVSVLKDKHLKFAIRQDGCSVDAIGFGLAESCSNLLDGPVDVLFQPSVNEWQGRKSVQCEIKDIRRAA